MNYTRLQWHGLSREEQAKYYEMARKERQLHMQMYPGWSARDNYALSKKKKRKRLMQHQQHKEVGAEGAAGAALGPMKVSSANTGTPRLYGARMMDASGFKCEGNVASFNVLCHSSPLSKTCTLVLGSLNINNLKKCRARFGVEQQELWCKPCM